MTRGQNDFCNIAIIIKSLCSIDSIYLKSGWYLGVYVPSEHENFKTLCDTARVMYGVKIKKESFV